MNSLNPRMSFVLVDFLLFLILEKNTNDKRSMWLTFLGAGNTSDLAPACCVHLMVEG